MRSGVVKQEQHSSVGVDARTDLVAGAMVRGAASCRVLEQGDEPTARFSAHSIADIKQRTVQHSGCGRTDAAEKKKRGDAVLERLEFARKRRKTGGEGVAGTAVKGAGAAVLVSPVAGCATIETTAPVSGSSTAVMNVGNHPTECQQAAERVEEQGAGDESVLIVQGSVIQEEQLKAYQESLLQLSSSSRSHRAMMTEKQLKVPATSTIVTPVGAPTSAVLAKPSGQQPEQQEALLPLAVPLLASANSVSSTLMILSAMADLQHRQLLLLPSGNLPVAAPSPWSLSGNSMPAALLATTKRAQSDMEYGQSERIMQEYVQSVAGNRNPQEVAAVRESLVQPDVSASARRNGSGTTREQLWRTQLASAFCQAATDLARQSDDRTTTAARCGTQRVASAEAMRSVNASPAVKHPRIGDGSPCHVASLERAYRQAVERKVPRCWGLVGINQSKKTRHISDRQ